MTTLLKLPPPRAAFARVVDEITGSTVDDVKSQLSLHGPVVELHVFVDSVGGCCDSAKRIVDAIKAHPAKKIITHGIGRVFSSAAAIFLAGDERRIAVGSAIQMHPAQANGDETHPAAIARSEQILDLFAERMPTIDRPTLREWQRRGTVFDHLDAVRLGLATGIDITQKVRTRVDTKGCNRPEIVTSSAEGGCVTPSCECSK